MPYYAAGDYYSAGDSYYSAGGLFSGIGKFLGGVAKVGIGFATGGVAGVASTLARGAVNALQKHPAAQVAPGNLPAIPAFTGQGIIQTGGLVNFAQQNLGENVKPGGGKMVVGPNGQLCVVHGMRRTHLNKSTYVRRGGGTQNLTPGLVLKGTECVPNRRTNPANPRALRRAIARVSGFGKLVRHAKKAVGRANTAVGNVHHARKKSTRR